MSKFGQAENKSCGCCGLARIATSRTLSGRIFKCQNVIPAPKPTTPTMPLAIVKIQSHDLTPVTVSRFSLGQLGRTCLACGPVEASGDFTSHREPIHCRKSDNALGPFDEPCSEFISGLVLTGSTNLHYASWIIVPYEFNSWSFPPHAPSFGLVRYFCVRTQNNDDSTSGQQMLQESCLPVLRFLLPVELSTSMVLPGALFPRNSLKIPATYSLVL